MNKQRHQFQKHSKLFSTYTKQIFVRSTEYNDVVHSLDALLLLADRVISATDQHPDFSRVSNVSVDLQRMALDNEAGNDESPAVDKLLGSVELWLKALLWLSFPQRWRDLHVKAKQFTLYTTIKELDLVSESELKLELAQVNAIQDPVRRSICLTYKFRNAMTHQTQDIDVFTKSQLLPSILVTLVAPVYKHRDALRERLRGLITGSLELGGLEVIVKTIASERRAHLALFAGRSLWLTRLQHELQRAKDTNEHYVLLTAPEGSGKSALIAKLTDVLGRQEGLLGAHTVHVTRQAPWLPAVLLHLGKQSAQPREIVQLLLAQANTLLMHPVILPPDNNDPDADMPFVRGETEHSRQRSNGQIDKERRLVVYRRVLYEALARLVEERGEAVLVIDALDEISMDGSDLAFLPDRLPPGAVALLTTRPESHVLNWLKGNRPIQTLTLDNLSREEIALMLDLDEQSSKDVTRFIDEVTSKSDGWALLVANTAHQLREQAGDYHAVHVEGSVDVVFERQAGVWQYGNPATGLLSHVLLLLAIFEPISPLDLEQVQGFIEYNQQRVSQHDVRRTLATVRSQIQGLDVGRIKLAMKPFAEYIRAQHWSQRDLRRALEAVVKWLVEDDDSGRAISTPFLHYWTNTQHIADPRLRNIAEGLVDQLVARGADHRLYEIATSGGEDQATASLKLRCLKESACLQYLPAMTELGIRLLYGQGVAQNVAEGEQWLRRASERGAVRAMLILGFNLAYGVWLPEDQDQGERWLQNAANAGYPPAIRELGNWFRRDYDHPEKQAAGEELLRKAVDAGDAEAMWELGRKASLSSRVEAEQWFRKAAEAGSTKAMLSLFQPQGFEEMFSRHLSHAQPLFEDSPSGADGEQWLRKAAALGDAEAMFELGKSLVFGDRLLQDVDEGARWLRKAVESWDIDPWALQLYATYLLDGDGLPQDVIEGEKWLRRAAATGDPDSIMELFHRLLYGHGLTQDRVEAERWLRHLAETGDPYARLNLGYRLVHGDGVPQNEVEGEYWLLLNLFLQEQARGDTLDKSRYIGQRACTADILLTRFRQGSSSAGAKLAYIIRRAGHLDNIEYLDIYRRSKTFTATLLPTQADLLVPSLAKRELFGVVNSALYLVTRKDIAADWDQADQTVGSIRMAYKDCVEQGQKDQFLKELSFIIAWWGKLAEYQEAEGHLVLGWLARHNIVADNGAWTVGEHLARARAGGWNVPAWMDNPVPGN